MGSFLYARPPDNIAPTATVTIHTGSAVTPPANLVDRNPAKFARATDSGTHIAWLFDFGTAKQVDLVAVIHHSIQSSAGAHMYIEANATDSWGSPAITQEFVLAATREDNFIVSPFLDLTGITPRTFRYWRLHVSGQTAINVGEVILSSTKRTLSPNLSWGAGVRDQHDVIEHRTQRGRSSLAYDLQTARRILEGEIDTTDAGLAALLSLWRSSRGRAKPFLIIPDASLNDAWFVKWTYDTELPSTMTFLDRDLVRVGFEEMSNGLPYADFVG